MVMPLLKRYVLALKRYKWAGLAIFLGVLGASGVVAIQPPPPREFKSEGVLVQNAPLVSFTATGVELQQQGQGIITQEFLLADVLLQRVAEQLTQQGLDINPAQIRRNTTIKIDAEGESLKQVTVTYKSDDKERAQAVLTLMFQGMVELSRVTNRARLGAILEALDERLPEVETELREAEQRLEAYDRVEGPAIQAALDGSLLGAISSSQTQRRQNLITLAGIEAQMRSLQSQLGLTPAQAYASSALSADPIIAQLRAQIHETETQLQLLGRDLRAAHPTVVELNANLESYNQLLRARAAEVIGGGGRLVAIPSGEVIRQNSNLDPARARLADELVNLSRQRDAIIQQQQVLAQSEVQLQEQYSSLPNKQLERDRLAQQVALKRALYDQIQAKRIDTQAAEAEIVSSLTVATPPAASLIPVEANNPLMVLALGGIFGVVLGGGVVFLLDMLDPTVRTYEDLDKLFENQDTPLLGLVPSMSGKHSPTGSALIIHPDHACADIYERLRSNLQLSGAQVNDGKVPHTVLITSTREQEGKTITAFNLGIASARAGRRTLIVEMDLRSRSQAKQLGVQLDDQAIIEPRRYYGGYLSDPVQMVPQVENLYISPSAGPQRNSAAVLDSSEMKRFLQEIKARFDFVIFDAPQITSSNDAMLLEPLSDGMIIVSRPDFTEKPILTATLDQLEENEEVRLLGAVINGAQIPIAEAQRKEDAFTVDNELEEDDEEVITTENIPVFTSVDF